jgi:hypothetical protein
MFCEEASAENMNLSSRSSAKFPDGRRFVPP